MCEINAFVLAQNDDKEELLYLEAIDIVRVEAGSVIYMKNLFGEERRFQGAISEISFRRGRMVLIPS